jgi:uncharacterized surface protein with fasciclin (FAS1) repeats
MSNIVEVVAGDRNLDVLGKSVKAAGMETTLSQNGPFTFFAPTDFAFGKLKEGQWPELLKPENKNKLTGIMKDHVVPGKTNFADLVDGQKLKTIGGKELTVQIINGAVNIEGARIQGRDMNASNGVVHTLDRVVPFN